MNQFGEVIKVKDNMAEIRVKKHTSCKNCGCCGMLTEMEGREVILEVENPIGATVGQIVRVTAEAQRVILASLLVYVLPVIVLVVAMYFTQQAAFNMGYGESAEIAGIIGGLGAMVLVFGVIRLLDKKISDTREFKPVITEVVPEEMWEEFIQEGKHS